VQLLRYADWRAAPCRWAGERFRPGQHRPELLRLVPVLAWPAGAVPYTLGGAGVLLGDRAPQAVADAMLALAADPARRAVEVESARRHSRRLS